MDDFINITRKLMKTTSKVCMATIKVYTCPREDQERQYEKFRGRKRERCCPEFK